MFGLSRLIAFAIVFCMGFGLATGLFLGIPAAVVASYSLRDLENTNLVNIPDEKFLSPDAEVDILDLNGIELSMKIISFVRRICSPSVERTVIISLSERYFSITF